MEAQWFHESKEFQDTEVINTLVLAHVFWNKDGVLLVRVDYLEKGETTTAKYVLCCTPRQTEAATGLKI
jgi:hypothetical protein